ncbi:MAG TPA: hypothetical protein VH325_08745 [Bryobacteraceae bacterium]|nr:hypothetical protein [Bryobacteraceae bacterium]
MPDQLVHLDSRRMLWVAPLTVAASVVAVLAVRKVAIRVIHPAPGFLPLTLGPPILDTILGCLGAILVFGAIVFYPDSVRTYRRVAAAVLLVSFIPDVLLATSRGMGGGWPEALFLMIMHVVVWAICVTVLPGLSITTHSEPTTKSRPSLSIR